MLVSELVEAARFLQEFAEKRDLVPTLQNVVNMVSQIAQGQVVDTTGSVAAAVSKLEALHREIDAAELSQASRHLIQQLGGTRVLGVPAIRRVRAILDEHGVSQSAVLALQSMASETGALVKRAKQLTTGLGPMLESLPEPQLAPDEGCMWLFFEHETAVDTMESLRDIADEWNEILHHFGRTQPGGISPTRILAIQKASPLIIEIAGAVALLHSILWGVNSVVATLGRIVELRKNYESLKQLQVKTQLLVSIADEVRTARQSIAVDAADEVQRKSQCDNEARNAVQVALEKIAQFIERGGKLDIELNKGPLPENTDGGTTAPEVRSLIEHLRKDLLALPPYENGGKTE